MWVCGCVGDCRRKAAGTSWHSCWEVEPVLAIGYSLWLAGRPWGEMVQKGGLGEAGEPSHDESGGGGAVSRPEDCVVNGGNGR